MTEIEQLSTAPVLAGEGRAVLAYMPSEREYDAGDAASGGAVAALLDEAMGLAVRSLLDRGDGAATTELRTSHRRAVRVESGPLRVEASVLHAGRASALSEARLVDAEGRLFAHATATWEIRRALELAA